MKISAILSVAVLAALTGCATNTQLRTVYVPYYAGPTPPAVQATAAPYASPAAPVTPPPLLVNPGLPMTLPPMDSALPWQQPLPQAAPTIIAGSDPALGVPQAIPQAPTQTQTDSQTQTQSVPQYQPQSQPQTQGDAALSIPSPIYSGVEPQIYTPQTVYVENPAPVIYQPVYTPVYQPDYYPWYPYFYPWFGFSAFFAFGFNNCCWNNCNGNHNNNCNWNNNGNWNNGNWNNSSHQLSGGGRPVPQSGGQQIVGRPNLPLSMPVTAAAAGGPAGSPAIPKAFGPVVNAKSTSLFTPVPQMTTQANNLTKAATPAAASASPAPRHVANSSGKIISVPRSSAPAMARTSTAIPSPAGTPSLTSSSLSRATNAGGAGRPNTTVSAAPRQASITLRTPNLPSSLSSPAARSAPSAPISVPRPGGGSGGEGGGPAIMSRPPSASMAPSGPRISSSPPAMRMGGGGGMPHK